MALHARHLPPSEFRGTLAPGGRLHRCGRRPALRRHRPVRHRRAGSRCWWRSRRSGSGTCSGPVSATGSDPIAFRPAGAGAARRDRGDDPGGGDPRPDSAAQGSSRLTGGSGRWPSTTARNGSASPGREGRGARRRCGGCRRRGSPPSRGAEVQPGSASWLRHVPVDDSTTMAPRPRRWRRRRGPRGRRAGPGRPRGRRGRAGDRRPQVVLVGGEVVEQHAWPTAPRPRPRRGSPTPRSWRRSPGRAGHRADRRASPAGRRWEGRRRRWRPAAPRCGRSRSCTVHSGQAGTVVDSSAAVSSVTMEHIRARTARYAARFSVPMDPDPRGRRSGTPSDRPSSPR